MKSLFILRHAHADGEPPRGADRDRPLTDRGRQEAGAIARRLEEIRPEGPDVVLCSAAARAQATAEAVVAAFPGTRLQVEEDLYGADPASWLAWLARQDESLDTALLVGHNPGLEALILALTGTLLPLSPATLAILVSPAATWRDVRPGRAQLRRVVRPG